MTAMKVQIGGLLSLLALALLAGAQDRDADGSASVRPGQPMVRAATALARLPLYFVENRGVCSKDVKYYIEGADKTLFFTDDGITIRLNGKERAWVVKLHFVGANPDVRPEGLDRQQATFSYFKGSEKNWKTALPTFAKVVYRELWPGIDLIYSGTVNQLKYEFLVAPGADPSLIRLRYRGADQVTLTNRGALRVETPDGSFADAPPVAFQEIDGKRVDVEMRYALAPTTAPGTHEFGFDIGNYDRTRPLVLDPAVLVYCYFIDGGGFDGARGVAVDSAGNVYIAGITESTENTFPVKVGPDLTHNGGPDAFVAKVNPQGTALVYCGYVGGAQSEDGWGIAVDATGSAYVTGSSSSDEKTFPVRIGPFLSGSGAFVAKVSPEGTRLVYCGFLGAGVDCATSIAVDGAGSAYPVGGLPFAWVAKVALTLLEQKGRPGVGATVNLDITASDSAGLTYVMGSSLGNGPIPIDQRKIELSPDNLLLASVGGYVPSIFQGYAGVVAPTGTATAAIWIPNLPLLVGVRIYTAFVTLKPSAPSGVHAISNTIDFTIDK